jgi:hypothetical protein
MLAPEQTMKYIAAAVAATIDHELMSTSGFSIDQLVSERLSGRKQGQVVVPTNLQPSC